MRETTEVAALVGGNRFVSIVGPGGIGKTRLALDLAWRVLDEFADGIWFVDVAPIGEGMVLARSLARTLGIPVADGQTDLEALVQHLERCRTLLVIDSCERVVDQVATLADRLLPSCHGVHALATSREPLHVRGERVYRLPPLATCAATELFVDRSRAARAGVVCADVAAEPAVQICRRLDGIALAIELAASRVGVFTPQQILAQLEDHFRMPAGLAGTALSRGRTLNETIRWSYDRLSGRDRDVLRCASIFANGFTCGSARRLLGSLGISHAKALESVASLVDKSLIVATTVDETTRYRLLEPVRAFGLEMLERIGQRPAVAQSFVQWCSTFSAAAHASWATTVPAVWLAQLEPELDNCRAALTWSLEERHDPLLGQSIVANSRRVWARLAPSEGRQWTELARRYVTPRTPGELARALALAQAHLDVMLSRYAPALAALRDFACNAPGEAGEADRAEAALFAGIALAQTGRVGEGIERMETARAVFAALDVKPLEADALAYLGIGETTRGNVVSGRDYFRRALALFRDLGNASAAARCAGHLAETESACGDVEAAIRWGEEAVASCETAREARIALANLAAYYVALGRYGEAREAAWESIRTGGAGRGDATLALALQHLAALATCRVPATSDDLALHRA
jgi:predicted ATPase